MVVLGRLLVQEQDINVGEFMKAKELENNKEKRVWKIQSKILCGISIFILVWLAVIVVLIYISNNAGPGNAENVKVVYQTSQMYSKEDMEQAVEVLKGEFVQFEGCTLKTLTYAGDDYSMEELDYINGDIVGGAYDQCIVFESYYTRNKAMCFFDGFPSEYSWHWILGRKNGGEWVLASYGYP